MTGLESAFFLNLTAQRGIISNHAPTRQIIDNARLERYVALFWC
jgi:hypothetical protein